MNKPATLCMAPWCHTYVSPQTERRMCCASREPAQNFQQYIDISQGSGSYQPRTLEQHWNGEHMRSVRRRMMVGETLPECEVCDNKLLNTDVYRTYFWYLFGDKYYQEIWNSTDSSGYTTMQPVSWDYRFSNLCNFKCRTCGDMLSSAWESEQRQHDMIDWGNPKNNWMRPDVRREISRFQDTEIEREFAEAVEQHRVEEIYWVGGEPLMYEQHWRYMARIIELGDGQRLYARYNTNLSRVRSNGLDLFDDILPRIRDWQICASIDGTGRTGEYIRTGLSWPVFLENFKRGIVVAGHRRQMRFDFTLTLPGLFEAIALQRTADELGVDVLAKVIFSFTPDIIMSPLALPRHILDRKIQEILPGVHGAMADVLIELQKRPCFQEQWPEQYHQGLIRGKSRILTLERIRKDNYTMSDILSADQEIHEWWKNIRTD